MQTVFVVDDDAAVRDSIQELVESVGLRAECYDSALAFLDAFTPHLTGCLVLDVRILHRQMVLSPASFSLPSLQRANAHSR